MILRRNRTVRVSNQQDKSEHAKIAKRSRAKNSVAQSLFSSARDLLFGKHFIVFCISMVATFGMLAFFNQAWAQAADCVNNPLQVECIYRDMITRLCWACPAFGAFYSGAIMLGYQVSNAIAGGVLTLLSIVLGIWLLLQVAKIMTPFGPSGGVSEIFNKIATKFLLFAVIVAFLAGGGGGFNAVWSWIISPIINSGIGMSTTVLASTSNLVGANATFYNMSIAVDNSDNCNMSSSVSANSNDVFPVNGLDSLNISNVEDLKDSGRKLGCMIFNVQKIMGVGAVLGVATAMNAGSDLRIPTTRFCVRVIGCVDLPDVGRAMTAFMKILLAVLMGVVLLIVYLVAMLLYPLYLIDAIFRFAIVVVISPILAAAYLFPITRSWTTTGIKMLVGVMFSFVFQAVLVGLSLSIIVATGNTLGNNVSAGTRDMTMSDAVAYGIKGNGLGDATAIVFFGYLLAGIMVLFMIRRANSLAQEFSGSAVGDIGGSLFRDTAGKAMGLATAAAMYAATGGAAALAQGAAGVASSAATTGKSLLSDAEKGGDGGGTGNGPPSAPPPSGGSGGGGGAGGGVMLTGVLSTDNFKSSTTASASSMQSYGGGITTSQSSQPLFSHLSNGNSEASQPFRSAETQEAFEAMKQYGDPVSSSTLASPSSPPAAATNAGSSISAGASYMVTPNAAGSASLGSVGGISSSMIGLTPSTPPSASSTPPTTPSTGMSWTDAKSMGGKVEDAFKATDSYVSGTPYYSGSTSAFGPDDPDQRRAEDQRRLAELNAQMKADAEKKNPKK